MKFGTPVIIERGSLTRTEGPGCKREVKGVLVGARGNDRIVRLSQDDPEDTCGWNKVGDVGRWSASAVRQLNAVSPGV